MCHTDPVRVCPTESQPAWGDVSYPACPGVSYTESQPAWADVSYRASLGVSLWNPSQPGQMCHTES